VITRVRVQTPMPDSVGDMLVAHLPKIVRDVDRAADNATRRFGYCRTPLTAQPQGYAIAELASANKILDVYSPKMTGRLGGAP
jgi:hypothetical protein